MKAVRGAKGKYWPHRGNAVHPVPAPVCLPDRLGGGVAVGKGV